MRNTTAQKPQQNELWCVHDTLIHVFEVISVNIILTTNHRGDCQKALEIMYHE